VFPGVAKGRAIALFRFGCGTGIKEQRCKQQDNTGYGFYFIAFY
jgi:hypothetical protein